MVRSFALTTLAVAMMAGLAAGTTFLLYQTAVRGNAGHIRPVAADAPPAPATAGSDDPLGVYEVAARAGDLPLPKDGGAWPWPVGGPGVSAPAAPAVPLPPSRSTAGSWAAAVSPTSGQAVVTVAGTAGGKPVTRILWCNASTGRVGPEWEVDGRLGVFDLHADGRRLLARRAEEDGAADDVLNLFTRTLDGKLTRTKWAPYADSPAAKNAVAWADAGSRRAPGSEVVWAGFVGLDHAASVSADGELKLWDLSRPVLEGNKEVGFSEVGAFGGVSGTPAVTPDGKKLAFACGPLVALLDPDSRAVVAARRVGKTVADPVLAWRGDGGVLAAAGNGLVTFLDLATGQTWDTRIPDLRFKARGERPGDLALVSDFGWAGDSHLYHDGSLFELTAPVPVWAYDGALWAAARGRTTWVLAREPGSEATALRPFALPHPGAKARVAAAQKRPGAFALRPGDAVTVDVSGLPEGRRAGVREALEKRLAGLGYPLNDGAAVTVRAWVGDADPTVNPGAADASRWTPARLRFEKGGETLWEASAGHGPAAGGAAAANPFGSPDYDLYTKRPLPAAVRGPAATDVLGRSTFAAHGLMDKPF